MVSEVGFWSDWMEIAFLDALKLLGARGLSRWEAEVGMFWWCFLQQAKTLLLWVAV